MEYIVLARKWRPRGFEDVVGQDHVVRTLKNAILQERIAHAFVFSGPRGVGKTSVARILAKALNCEKGASPTPCHECANCREITAGTSMDVHEIDGASNRGIDEIRELRENVRFSPASSRYKIYIIDEVHMLTREAFNALLKTLEEPPPHVIFIFATTETHKIPATILSRCQCFDFRRIPLKQIRDSLGRIAAAEGVTVSEAGLTWIAGAGDGSLRDAQSVLDQIISYAGFVVGDEQIEEVLGLGDRRFLFLLSGAVLERDAGRCLQIIGDAYYAGLDMKHFYQALLGHFRNLLLTKISGQDRALFELSDDDMARLAEQTKNVARETLLRLLDILMAEEEPVRRSSDSRLTIETVLVRMAYLEPALPIGEILVRMEGLEKRLASGTVSAAAPAPGRKGGAPLAPRSPVMPVTGKTEATSAPEKIENGGSARHEIREPGPRPGSPPVIPADIWGDYKEFIKKQSQPLWSKIEAGKFLGYEKGCLRMGFPPGYIFLDELNQKTLRNRLAELSTAFFGEDVTVKIETVEAGPEEQARGTQNGSQKNNRINDIKREALSHPLLQKVLDVFEGAEVRDVIPRGNHR